MNQSHMLIIEADRFPACTHTQTRTQARTQWLNPLCQGLPWKHRQIDEEMEWMDGRMDGWTDAEIDSSPVCLLPFSPPLSAHYPG